MEDKENINNQPLNKKQKNEDPYDMLVDDFIDFIKNETIDGVIVNEEQNEYPFVDEKRLSIDEVKKLLPIYKLKEELIKMVRDNQFLIIEGETGSGKSTQIPQYLYEAGFCDKEMKIGCIQPRRVAVMSVAARVAKEMRVTLGETVGYSLQFESQVSEQTQIKFMTDRRLLQEFIKDPILSSFSVLVVDEAHERTLQTDIIFGLLRELMDERPKLKIIICCATCDTDKFCNFFEAKILKIPGRRYAVETYYTHHQEANFTDAAVIAVLQIHITQKPGDILVFLTGQEEIEDVIYSLSKRVKCLGSTIPKLIILPIYSLLPREEQVKIFCQTPPGARKVVLATNIAETSLTIEGIKYVIDCGFCKQKWFDPRTRIDALKVVPISKAAAIQRSGRAGRVASGKCFRLYKKCTFDDEFDDQPVPEIQRTNLTKAVLLLNSLGIQDIGSFQFMDRPYGRSIMRAVEELFSLGALNIHGKLSLTGRKMVEIPCDPMISKMILVSEKYGCSDEIMTIAAMVSHHKKVFEGNQFFADQPHRKLLNYDGDQLTLLKIYNEYAANNFSSDWCRENKIQTRTMEEARKIRNRLVGLIDRLEIKMVSKPDDTVAIRMAITAGFFLNAATSVLHFYKRIKAKDIVYMHPSSVFSILEDNPRYVVYDNILATNKEYMGRTLRIEPGWLKDVAPHIYQDADFDGDQTFKKMPISRKY